MERNLLEERRNRSTVVVKKCLSFKDLRGFKEVKDITKLYSWKKELGSGQFGTVHEAMHNTINTKCAVKVI